MKLEAVTSSQLNPGYIVLIISELIMSQLNFSEFENYKTKVCFKTIVTPRGQTWHIYRQGSAEYFFGF